MVQIWQAEVLCIYAIYAALQHNTFKPLRMLIGGEQLNFACYPFIYVLGKKWLESRFLKPEKSKSLTMVVSFFETGH